MKYFLIGISFSFVFFSSCGFLDLKKAEDISILALNSIKNNDWDTIWKHASVVYRKKIPKKKFDVLKNWTTNEFGKMKSYKKLLLYSGSDPKVTGQNYVTVTYEINCTKGYGEIEIIIINEKGEYKIYRMDISKKPSM